jgi:hypothetical protein
MDKLIKSLEYSALDHKWSSRNYLKEQGWTQDVLYGKLQTPELNRGVENAMIKIALSAFRYYVTHYDNISRDKSLAAVTCLCSSGVNSLDVDSTDPEVYYLSKLFNRLVGSTRKLLQCYDCGTNARALFLRLIEVGRGQKKLRLSKSEVERMSEEYLLNKDRPLEVMRECWTQMLADDKRNLVIILSIGVQDFGHIWVFEKKYFDGKARIHQYQSALGSHMLIDFIEAMDYGADPMRSLDVNLFFTKLENVLSCKEAWKDEQYRLFAELFAFNPVYPVTKPDPGFCWTWASY